MTHPIPSAALDDRLAFVGTPGSGKTYNAGSGVERLLASGARVVIPDPLGVWWGLALEKDGKDPSSFRTEEKLVIFGGPHGDLPLTEHAGALIGETVASMAESCILDLSEIGTKAGERRFMLAFLSALYNHKTRQPLHMIFDEADMWAPQRLLDKEGEAAKLLGMMETVVRRGRVKGFICWFITQRPAVLSWNVLSMVDGVVTFKLTSSHDRDAIGNWVEGQADKAQWKEIWKNLPTLERGEGFVWLPHRGILKRSKFPEKVTFDSSRAPKRGERLKSAKPLKPVNLDKLKERLATVESEAKANDPSKLRSEIATLKAEKVKLERQVGTPAKAGKTAPDTKAIAVAEKHAVEQARKQMAALRAALEVAMKFIVEINAKGFFRAGGKSVDKKAIEKAITAATDHIEKLVEQNLAQRDREIGKLKQAGERLIERLQALLKDDIAVKVDVTHSEQVAVTSAKVMPLRPLAAPSAPLGDGTYSGPQHKVLRSLAMWRSLGHEQPTREMVAAIAGYKPSTGNYGNLIGSLVTIGAVGKSAQGRLSLLADNVEVISLDEGRAMLIGTLNGPQRKIVASLVDAGVKTREQLAADTGYQPGTGNYGNLLGSLNTIGVTMKPAQGQIALSDWAQELLTGYAERIAA